MPYNAIDTRSINTIRTLSIDMVQRANSGHPGLPLGAAPMAYVLWHKHLKFNPDHKHWPDRDRFVLSAGHGSALQYSLLHLTGFDLGIDDLKAFRQWESRTPGHPEAFMTAGVEATTGPLGQGAANAVGMAIAERALAHYFNRPGHNIVDHHTYALVSDGDLMEGVCAEAASLAGHLRLSKLIYMYDSNQVSLDGPTAMSFTGEDAAKRFEAYGWHVIEVPEGDTDLDAIDSAIAEAREQTGKPTLIIVHTTIGFGSPKQGLSEVHGAPLGEEGAARAKQNLGMDAEKFFDVPDDVAQHFRQSGERGRKIYDDWQKRFDAYDAEYPDLAAEWKARFAGELPEGWDRDLPTWNAGEKLATRKASGAAINAIAKHIPLLIGGDADLSSSTSTAIKGGGSFDGQTGEGRNIHYGVREHAMGAAANGIAYHGGMRSFVATFFNFSDYMRPSVRLAAMTNLPVIFVWTHDSIALGEDGPTHQPVEHLMSLRAMPGMTVVRPGDANETAEAWRFAINHTSGPVALVLTRQDLPVFDRSKLAPAANLARGAYVLADPPEGEPEVIIIATGSELQLAVAAYDQLTAEGIRARVVSMPCWEAFAAQPEDYRLSVLPDKVRARVAVEAGATLGWERHVGCDGAIVGIDRFGASAPGKVNLNNLGFTPEHVVAAARDTLKRCKERLNR